MIFINKSLQEEYERLSRLYPDMEGIDKPLINVSDVLNAYFALADYFADPDAQEQEQMLVGLRSIDLLCSAIGRQAVSYAGQTKYTDPRDICSTLFFGLVKDHAFSDGNKRTALLVLLYQKWTYGYYPSVGVNEFEKLVVAVAANKLSSSFPFLWKKNEKEHDREVKTISSFLRKSIKKKDHTFHLTITMNTFVEALRMNDVNFFVDKGKIHFERSIKQKWPHKPKVLKYAATFGGWTRAIGAATAREALVTLELYDQFQSYQSFINGDETFYSYIAQFEGPLRRLKDE